MEILQNGSGEHTVLTTQKAQSRWGVVVRGGVVVGTASFAGMGKPQPKQFWKDQDSEEKGLDMDT